MAKFTFDGVNRRIISNTDEVLGGVFTFTITELWTEWVDWVAQGDNLKYQPALSSVMIPLTATEFVGPYLFIRNDLGWRGVPPDLDNVTVMVEGSLFGQDPELPVMMNNPSQTTDLIINRSALTATVAVDGTSGGGNEYTLAQIAQAVWAYSNRTVTQPVATPADVLAAVFAR